MSPTKRRLIITLATLLLVAMAPAVVMAAGGQFTDDDDSIFEAHIEWMADAGVTAGCNPPANDHFCPNDNVNRGQMAAFMRRFAQYIGAEDGTPALADHAATADSAADASRLNGMSSNQFQPTTNDFENATYSVTADVTATVASASVSTNSGASYLCRLGSTPTADIRLHASGNVGGLNAGETASFYLEDSSGAISNTTRWVSDSYGSFAIDWLYELIPGGDETFELIVTESAGDTFSVNAVILAEVISETRCKGIGTFTLSTEQGVVGPDGLTP